MNKPTAQPLNERMLTVMAQEYTKSQNMTISLVLKDGTKRTGIYKDLVVNPLNNLLFKGVQFIKLQTTKQEHDIVYLPITLVDTVEWSY